MSSLRLPCQKNQPSSFGTQAIDASTDGAGAIFLAPKTGTITKIGCLITAKAGTAPTFRFGVEGVSGTNAPDGTYKTGGTAYVDEADPAAAFAWRTLGASVSVTAGDELAATIRYLSGTIDGSNNITVGNRVAEVVSGTYLLPYPLALTAGTWGVGAGLVTTVLQYDDGTVLWGTCPANTITNNTWNSGSSPIYRGTKWTPAVTCQCVGVWLNYRTGTAADYNVKVFEGAATSPVATRAVDVNEHTGTTSSGLAAAIPLTPFTLTAGTIYRFVVEPTTVTNGTTFNHLIFTDADLLAAYYGDLKGTTGVAGSPPTWTDYDNGSDGYRAYPIIPIIDDITASGGGGGSQRVICG